MNIEQVAKVCHATNRAYCKRFDRIYTTDSFEHQTSAPITVLR